MISTSIQTDIDIRGEKSQRLSAPLVEVMVNHRVQRKVYTVATVTSKMP